MSKRLIAILLISPAIFVIGSVLLWHFANPLSLGPLRWIYSTNRDTIDGSSESVWNWGFTVQFSPRNIETPKTIEELQHVVKSAEGIRVVGGGHSFNSQISTPCTLVDLRYINYIELCNAYFSVRVGAGVKIRHLQHYLVQRNLMYIRLGEARTTNPLKVV